MKKKYYVADKKQDFPVKLHKIFSEITNSKLPRDHTFKPALEECTLPLENGDRLVYEIRLKGFSGDLYVKWKVKGPKETSKGIVDGTKDGYYFILCVRKHDYDPPPITDNYRDN